MSSTHSSPTKRSILSPKPSNISNSSPFGKRYTRLTPSPTKHSYKSTTPSPKKSTLGFTIWEDKVDKSNSTTSVVGQTTSNKLNHNDQENILQPKKEEIVRHNGRKVLGNLSINEYKGYITVAGTRSQLTELYQPINFDNEFKSLHKQSNLPSYLTPSRRNRDEYLVKSGIDEIEEECVSEDEEDANDDDEVEVLLMKKKQQRSSTNQTHMIRKHTRSMSLGKNEAKLNLIRKNKFSILSN
ncbi:conserved hypothetical protein [Candida tropicalis MYA-3404]|uniref:Uncharacterized protein n=1 Tax=Candida tropicalis (strain ATCC MYA-3404 / T1) TaxID=294747 RepID=C5M8S4_CANTT|nr:conserved hypothetical protein [Candida tropicalis MYA-3404]EER33978.1 conserved hypothetical protein [Candida tropicalis MYA-3404]KAG4407833.1 hypothetical protein JTP64_003368 [Candida tropicalis]